VSLTLPKEGERLDRYLVRLGFAASRRGARELIVRGLVHVNGHRYCKGDVVSPGDRVEVAPGAETAALQPDRELKLEVLFEDAAVVAVNKPGLIPCHPLRSGAGATVMNAMAALFPETAAVGEKPTEGGLVHRLDNGTSGALLIARTNDAFVEVREAIRNGRVARRYLALVARRLEGRLEMRAPIAHHPRNRRKMVVVSDAEMAGRFGARPAVTLAEPLRRIDDFTLITVVPATGSRHQIRVHLASAGYPIVGDELYGGPLHCALALGRFWLHLGRVQFDSPASGRITLQAPLPPDLRAALH
jgi:23S rRNA pseudouridine1911/1915/1917 synthase